MNFRHFFLNTFRFVHTEFCAKYRKLKERKKKENKSYGSYNKVDFHTI